MFDIETQLTEDPLPPVAAGGDPSYGAEVTFQGVVRGTEDGDTISGIEYSAYRPLVERSLRELGGRAEAKFGEHRARISHRTGFVPVAEPSVDIRVSTPHSREAFEIASWYLAAVKTELPIWKRVVPSPPPA